MQSLLTMPSTKHVHRVIVNSSNKEPGYLSLKFRGHGVADSGESAELQSAGTNYRVIVCSQNQPGGSP